MTGRSQWIKLRQMHLARTNGQCEAASEKGRQHSRIFDLVAYEGEYRVLCRACRLRLDAPRRVARAQITRDARRRQLALPFPQIH